MTHSFCTHTHTHTGDTGPLVYPAGFLYLYSALYFLTGHGANVRLAQYIFIGIYLLQMWLVLRLYTKSRKLPPYVLVISAFTSYRIHSIYTLRLFNDPLAIVFLYAAINMFLDGRWTWGSVLFSLGVSVKMNVLLFAPAIFILYLTNFGTLKTAIQLMVCAVVQLLLGAPFLLTYPWAYLKGSFDLGRVFEHKWTVNYRFLPREIFENRYFHLALLIAHIGLLSLFAVASWRYMSSYARLRTLQRQLQPQIDAKNVELQVEKRSKKNRKKTNKSSSLEEEPLTDVQQKFLNSFESSLKKSTGSTVPTPAPPPSIEEQKEYSIFYDKSVQLALLPIFLANFIGVVCARSLHYQFYVWYFHSLPYLVWYTNYTFSLRLLLLGMIEFAWNTYPSTDVSSLMLHVAHAILLFGIGKVLLRNIKIKEQ